MRRPYVAALALAGILACLAAYWGFGRSRMARPRPGTASIEFLDVGQGDAILIRSPEGRTALVDAGPSGRIVEILHDRGIVSIDLVVVSHHHFDHYGGMDEVIREFRPRAFLDADSPYVTANYVALLRLVKSERIMAIRAGAKGRTIMLGSVALRVFPQAPPHEGDENNNSVGIRVDYGRFSAVLPGDAEGPERRWWIKNVPDLCADVDVLKLAHHGSRNGTNAAWLRLTRPRLAVASLAAGNEFGHPHPETLGLLRSLGIPLERTDQAGSILIETDGRTWSPGRSSAPSRVPYGPDRGSTRSKRRATRKGMIRLNSAYEAAIRDLPGIGPTTASRIIVGRPYRSIDDLPVVSNLDKKCLDQIRPFRMIE